MRKLLTILSVSAVLALCAVILPGTFSRAAAGGPGPSGYHLVKTVPVSGDGFCLRIYFQAGRQDQSCALHIRVLSTHISCFYSLAVKIKLNPQNRILLYCMYLLRSLKLRIQGRKP